MFTIHVVAHTHWDREWYHTQVRFRQRLVALVDELLDDPPIPPASFLLDGQAIVLEDYLAVRPERLAELSASLQRGTLEAGPWYVLPDELIPSGEALVRNLLLGRRVSRGLRAEPPPVLYCPDSFGHPATLPLLAAGFGLPLIILWRGYGGARWPAGDVVRWRSPDGGSVLLFHLPRDGYEYGSHLPDTDGAAQERWGRIRAELGARTRAAVLLLQNGADHHARQERHREALTALSRAARDTGDDLRPSSLGAFAAELVSRAHAISLPAIEGELRDSYGYTWTLQGTFGTRASQKRRNALAERLLVRDAEPWAALARRRGALSRLPLLIAAWKTLLQAHPHDTLCGCSIDAVSDAMDRRLADAVDQARGIRDDALIDLLGHDPVVARAASTPWQPVVIVRNRAARARGGVAVIELRDFVAHVPVGPGSRPAAPLTARVAGTPGLASGSELQILRRRIAYDRVESPRHYPDNDLVTVTHAAVWLDSVAGYGTSSIPIGPRRADALSPPLPVRTEQRALENGLIRVAVDEGGVVSLEHHESGRRIDSLLAIEDRADQGDLYTPSIRETASVAHFEGARLTHRGPLIGELLLRWRLLDADLADSRRSHATLAVRLIVEAAAPWLRLRVDGRNFAKDHRLRLIVRTDIAEGDVWADAAFGCVRRVPIPVPDEDRRMETPPPTAPLHRYVSLFDNDRGATLYSDGLAEYETTRAGELIVTLVRAIGELSRNDLPERPGHAGWPAPTPRAQSYGAFKANLALMLHRARASGTVDAIERAAEDILLPLEGTTLRAALTVPAPTQGVELQGEGLAFSALKDAEQGEGAVARCVNLLDQPVDGRWRFGFPFREARLARLDETPLAPLTVTGDTVTFHAPPRAVITILVR